jgi:hypothetical protein
MTLSDQLKSQISISDNQVKYIYRDRDVVKYKTVYVPVESSVTITTDQDDRINIEYSPWGWCFYPFLGVGLRLDSVQPELGVRLLYFNKFGLGLNTTFDSLNAEIDYRLSWGVIRDSAIGLFGGNRGVGLSFHTFL